VARPYGSYVIENVLFKISYPAEFHAQTAVEAAVALHPQVRDHLVDVERIVIWTQESALRIIDKRGPLHNPADRDHCLQYAAAIGLIHGTLTAEHYEEEAARDPRVDALRARMELVEDPRYSRDYLDPEKRSVANAIEVTFRDGTHTSRVEVEYPIGHRRRRAEGIPLLARKFETSLATRLPAARVRSILALFEQVDRLDTTPIDELIDLFVVSS
jgi:2-methylcitrate dehydratase